MSIVNDFPILNIYSNNNYKKAALFCAPLVNIILLVVLQEQFNVISKQYLDRVKKDLPDVKEIDTSPKKFQNLGVQLHDDFNKIVKPYNNLVYPVTFGCVFQMSIAISALALTLLFYPILPLAGILAAASVTVIFSLGASAGLFQWNTMTKLPRLLLKADTEVQGFFQLRSHELIT